MVNSGHSVKSAQFILVLGTTRFLEMLRRSKLDSNHREYKPVHCDREFDKFNRKKLLAKTSWYDDETLKVKTNWRNNLPEAWSGSKPAQHSAQGMRYTTVLQVPNSQNGKLFRMLAHAEPRIAKLTVYQAKMTEMSGKSLSKMLSKFFNQPKCPRICCAVCSYSTRKGPTLCQLKSVVYMATCSLCDSAHALDPNTPHQGRYVGETSRTLAERAAEHRTSFRQMEQSSFMFKHWVLKHGDLQTAPKFTFEVIKHHKDPLSRLVGEAVVIQEKSALNSKSEWGGYRIGRLTVEKSEFQARKDLKSEGDTEKSVNDQLDKFRKSAIAARTANNDNNLVLSRKRKTVGDMTGSKKMKQEMAVNPSSTRDEQSVKQNRVSTSTPTSKTLPKEQTSTQLT